MINPRQYPVMKRLLPTLFLLLALPAMAADPRTEKKVLITGWGTQSCGTFNANTNARASAADWVMGFLSGVNWEDPKNRTRGEETTNAGIVDWLANYCRSHPEDYIMQAAMTLTMSFEKTAAEKQPASSGKRSK